MPGGYVLLYVTIQACKMFRARIRIIDKQMPGMALDLHPTGSHEELCAKYLLEFSSQCLITLSVVSVVIVDEQEEGKLLHTVVDICARV